MKRLFKVKITNSVTSVLTQGLNLQIQELCCSVREFNQQHRNCSKSFRKSFYEDFLVFMTIKLLQHGKLISWLVEKLKEKIIVVKNKKDLFSQKEVTE